jgi:hypothetical protein
MFEPASTRVGLIELITGMLRTVKLLLEVAVDDPTVTVTGPVVAPVGTVTVKLFADAAVTVAVVPLNRVRCRRRAEILPLNRDGRSNTALCGGETTNRKRARRRCGSCNRKQIPDGIVVIVGYIPGRVNDRGQSAQSVINILDRIGALRPERKGKTKNEQKGEAC